jgi:chemotaxis protein MotB
MAENKRPIIIIKKKGGHAAHHGGAWKVAYADFVTAMMALFMVLWLMNASAKVQKAIGGYFKDPTGMARKVGTSESGSGESIPIRKEDMKELKDVLIRNMRKQLNDFEKIKSQIDMTVTAEGLRIELIESAKGTFFESGRSDPSADGKDMLNVLAQTLGTLPNKISLEGHTDSQPFPPGAVYTNWELSADRANAARRLMQVEGIRADQISQVRGYADQRLRKPANPQDPSNRRITVIVQYIPNTEAEEEKENEEAKAAEGKGAEHGEGKPEHGQVKEHGKPAEEKPAAAKHE